MLNKALIVAAAVSAVAAQRPNDTSICDYYTTALLMENNATNQMTLLTLVVNTAVIGNYTEPNVGIAVPGILNPNGTYMGTPVNLVPYFDGTLASTNSGNGSARSVNFLDDGGAAPLMMNMPANGTSSAQYRLLTHLYSFFGSLLGCSMVGMDGFPAYGGNPSQYDVHKFMALGAAEMGYFIQQVGLSAASFGVADEDVAAVGMALNTTFGLRCAPEAAVIPDMPELQSICIADDCPISPNATCEAYANVMEPMTTSPATSSMMPTGTSSTMEPTGTTDGGASPTESGSEESASAMPENAAGSLNSFGSYIAAAAAGVAAFAL